ncbi:SIK3 kinase, partial [Acromyrmex heyeri]
MLVVEPERRLSISQILAHSWMSEDGVIELEPGGCNPDVSVPLPLNQLVIENMLRLPGLSADTLLQAIKGNTFDHVSAIYNLLVDRLEPTMPNLHSIQSIPGDYLPDGAHQLEKFGETEAETEEKSGLYLPSGTPYHTTRRHTVGPGDAVHQSPSSYPYHHMSGYQTLRPLPVLQCNMDPQVLPHTNLPLNLPLVQHQPPQNFQIKDQHLLKPPPVMGATGGFGRRASDGGANLHIFHQQHSSNINNDEDNGWSQPGSREQLQSRTLKIVSYFHFCTKNSFLRKNENKRNNFHDLDLDKCYPDHDPEQHSRDFSRRTPWIMPAGVQKRDPVFTREVAFFKEMFQTKVLQSGSSGLVPCAQSLNVAVSTATGDGSNNNSGNNSGSSDRRRRSGLSTVMQRPVINPELVMEVEARMNRAYLPSRLLPTHLRGSTLPHHRKSSLYHTSTVSNRESYKEPSSHVATERYSPVRRASEGSGAPGPGIQALQQEYQQLQRLASPSHSPASIPGSPVHERCVAAITQGLSGLTTTSVQGSIVHGTPAQPPATPLDLSPLRHHRSPATTPVSYSPSNSPALDMIQEEHPVEISRLCHSSAQQVINIERRVRRNILHRRRQRKQSFHCISFVAHCSSRPSREECGINIASYRKSDDHKQKVPPQISVTDVLGGQVTLISCSPSPSPSPDSLEDTLPHYNTLPSFIISEPCDPSRPSITRGIGRPHNTIPTEVEVPLSDESSRLNSETILGRVKQIIDARAPPKGFIFSREEVKGSGLSLEYPGGVQIELRVFESEERETKGIKMRRISGDQLQYSQLCQQLISCITV